MLCPRCDEEMDGLRCQECGSTWSNVLMVGGAKYQAIMKTISTLKVETNRDCLALVGELTKLDAAYTEMIDELTTGAKL